MKSEAERIKELEKLIEKYQASYYNGEGEISDGQFDLLWDELKALAPESRVLKKVGTAPLTDGFPKAKHIIPMGSQDKASNPQEFLEWAAKQTAFANKQSIKSAKKTDDQLWLTDENEGLT